MSKNSLSLIEKGILTPLNYIIRDKISEGSLAGYGKHLCFLQLQNRGAGRG